MSDAFIIAEGVSSATHERLLAVFQEYRDAISPAVSANTDHRESVIDMSAAAAMICDTLRNPVAFAEPGPHGPVGDRLLSGARGIAAVFSTEFCCLPHLLQLAGALANEFIQATNRQIEAVAQVEGDTSNLATCAAKGSA